MSQILNVKASIEVPLVPNFLRITDGQSIPVCAISDEGLSQIGAAWTLALIELAKEQREGLRNA